MPHKSIRRPRRPISAVLTVLTVLTAGIAAGRAVTADIHGIGMELEPPLPQDRASFAPSPFPSAYSNMHSSAWSFWNGGWFSSTDSGMSQTSQRHGERNDDDERKKHGGNDEHDEGDEDDDRQDDDDDPLLPLAASSTSPSAVFSFFSFPSSFSSLSSSFFSASSSLFLSFSSPSSSSLSSSSYSPSSSSFLSSSFSPPAPQFIPRSPTGEAEGESSSITSDAEASSSLSPPTTDPLSSAGTPQDVGAPPPADAEARPQTPAIVKLTPGQEELVEQKLRERFLQEERRGEKRVELLDLIEKVHARMEIIRDSRAFPDETADMIAKAVTWLEDGHEYFSTTDGSEEAVASMALSIKKLLEIVEKAAEEEGATAPSGQPRAPAPDIDSIIARTERLLGKFRDAYGIILRENATVPQEVYAAYDQASVILSDVKKTCESDQNTCMDLDAVLDAIVLLKQPLEAGIEEIGRPEIREEIEKIFSGE